MALRIFSLLFALAISLYSANLHAQQFTSTTTTVIEADGYEFSTFTGVAPASDGNLYIFYSHDLGLVDGHYKTEYGIASIGNGEVHYYPHPNITFLPRPVTLKEIDHVIYLASQYRMYSFDMASREWGIEPIIRIEGTNYISAQGALHPYIISSTSFYTYITTETEEPPYYTEVPVQALGDSSFFYISYPKNASTPLTHLSDERVIWRGSTGKGPLPLICPATGSIGTCIKCQIADKYGAYVIGSFGSTELYGSAFKNGQYYAAYWEVSDKKCVLKFLPKSPSQNMKAVNASLVGVDENNHGLGSISNGVDDVVYWKTLNAKPVSIKKKFPWMSNPRRLNRDFRMSSTGKIAGIAFISRTHALKYTLLTPISSSN